MNGVTNVQNNPGLRSLCILSLFRYPFYYWALDTFPEHNRQRWQATYQLCQWLRVAHADAEMPRHCYDGQCGVHVLTAQLFCVFSLLSLVARWLPAARCCALHSLSVPFMLAKQGTEKGTINSLFSFFQTSTLDWASCHDSAEMDKKITYFRNM